VLVVLLLVGGIAVHLRAQTAPQPGLAWSDDVALRQQITALYPTQLPEVPQPWFNPPGAAQIALGGELQPLVGKLAFYVRYGKAHFGARGGGAADDVEVMVAFMHALTGTQRPARPEGVQPPRLWRSREAD